MRRVAVWGTGNMGATAIRSATAFPGLELAAVITSSEDKAGRDAASFAKLDSPTGVTATTDVDAALAQCDAVAYMSSGDIRPEEALAEIEQCLRAGKQVVTPSLYSLYDPASAPVSGSSGSPTPRWPATPHFWSAVSTRAGAMTLWR